MNFEKIFEYLYIKDTPEIADLIIAFGHFDKKIPETCADLYQKGLAPVIVCTGGVGAGSTGLCIPEAIYFKEILQNKPYNIPQKSIITETQSTNTGENIRFTSSLLENNYPAFSLNSTVRRIILVATAYRQFRVYYTMKLYFPNLILYNVPPKTTYQTEQMMFKTKGESLEQHLVGEMERIKTYPSKGYMAECPNFWDKI